MKTEIIISAVDKATPVLKKVSGGLDGLTSAVKNPIGAMTNLSGKFAGLAIATGLLAGFEKMVKESIDTAANYGKMSEKIGMSTNNISTMIYASKLPVEDFEKSMVKLNKFIASTPNNYKNTTDAVYKLADEFKKMPNGAEKTKMALDAFGKAGANMIPMLNKGSEGIKKMQEEAKKLGVEVDTNFAASARKYQANLKTMDIAMKGIGMSVTKEVMPAMLQISESFKVFAKYSATGKSSIFEGIATGFKIIVTAVYAVIGGVVQAGNILGTYGAAVAKVLTGQWGDIGKTWDAGYSKMKQTSMETMESIKALWTKPPETAGKEAERQIEEEERQREIEASQQQYEKLKQLGNDYAKWKEGQDYEIKKQGLTSLQQKLIDVEKEYAAAKERYKVLGKDKEKEINDKKLAKEEYLKNEDSYEKLKQMSSVEEQKNRSNLEYQKKIYELQVKRGELSTTEKLVKEYALQEASLKAAQQNLQILFNTTKNVVERVKLQEELNKLNGEFTKLQQDNYISTQEINIENAEKLKEAYKSVEEGFKWDSSGLLESKELIDSFASGLTDNLNNIAQYMIDLSNNTWDKQRENIDKQAAAYRQLGMDEITIAKWVESEKTKISNDEYYSRLEFARSAAGGLASIAKGVYEMSSEQSKEAFTLYKAFAIAETSISTFSAAQKSYEALAGIPYVGPILGGIAAAAAVAAGIAKIAQISAMQPGSKASGSGGSTGGISAGMLSNPPKPPEQLTKEKEALSNSYVINIHGNVVDNDKFARELMESIKKAEGDGV